MTGWWRMILALCMVLLLCAIPVARPASYFLPMWGLLFALYIEYTLPKFFNSLYVLILGFLLDALSGGLIGLYPFVLLLTTWVASIRARQFRLFTMPQQMLGILGLCFLYQSVILMIQWGLNYPVYLPSLLIPAMVSTLCWPWFQYLGDSVFFTRIS